ncbi:TonB dependent receptor [bacterium BMS3Abin04]|nr:TonB dependent receptor [bacterium BMS3Abin04]
MKTNNLATNISLNKLIKFISVLLFLMFITQNVFGQSNTGSIIGQILDGSNGEPLIGANVIVQGLTIGAAADIDGGYKINKVPAGNYTLIFSMVGYSKKTVKNVEVKTDRFTKINIILDSKVIQTKEVVVTAKALNNTEASLLSKRQKSVAISDAVSAEQFSKSGAGNAAEAVKQVVGASVVDGKYVYVRGLGDRYTSTQLNGAEIPSIDPYKRAGSIDLIPANLIDNIQAIKTFTPDRPGDFSGGIVDIATKDFPEKLNFSLTASSSYNSQITFDQNGLGSIESATDWLGMDNGMRDLPSIIGEDTYVPLAGRAQTDNVLAKQIDDITKAFSPEMNPNKRTVPVNQSYSFSLGNQFDFFGRPLGYLLSLSYKRNQSGYFDGQVNRWSRGVIDPNKAQLDTTFFMKDRKSVDDVLWGGILKVSYRLSPHHKISINELYNQNGNNSVRFISGSYPYDQNSDWLYQVKSIQYKERSLNSVQLNGEHQFLDILNMKIDWRVSSLNSYQNEPDLRFFYDYVTQNDVYGIKSNLAPERYFRKTYESKKEFQLNFSIPFKQWNQETGKVKFGGLYSDKKRDFRERRFVYSPSNRLGTYLRRENGNISQLFSDKYLGWVSTDTLGNGKTLNRLPVYIQETDQTSSDYNANNIVKAVYGMIDLPVFTDLRFIGGLRLESTNMIVNSIKEGQEGGKIKTDDLLPSVNLIYSPLKNMNIRTSYGKTLARPNFREISSFSNYDFNGGDRYVGNPGLGRTLIDNYDLRWEWFTRPGEVFSVSLFMKEFKDPIEIKILDAVNNVLSWTNVDRAYVKGIELEVRTRLDFIGQAFKEFSVGGNLSLISSEVDIDKKELESIKLYEPNASDQRPFQGQSPYILNLNLNYENIGLGLSASVFYNVFGKRLSAVGSVGAPDVYEKPFHMLNLSVSKKIYSTLSLKLSANNILNNKIEKIQEFKGTEYVYSSYSTGTTYSVSLKYRL